MNNQIRVGERRYRVVSAAIGAFLALLALSGIVSAQNATDNGPRRLDERIDRRVDASADTKKSTEKKEGQTEEEKAAEAESKGKEAREAKPGGAIDDSFNPEKVTGIPSASDTEEIRVGEEGPQPEKFDIRLPGAQIDEGPISESYRYLGRLPSGTRFQGTKGAGKRLPLAGLYFGPSSSDIAHEYMNKLLKISGNATVGVRYTDNVYLEPDDRKTSDWIFIVSPNINFEIGGENGFIEFKYRPVIVLPTVSGDQNGRVDHEFILSSSYKPHRTLKFIFVDTFGIRAVEADFERDEYDRFYDNSTTFTTIYQPLESWALEATYDHYFVIFKDRRNNSDDLYQDTFRANLYRQIWQKVWFFVYGSYAYINNRNDLGPTTDNREYSGGVGLRWAPNSRFNGRIDVGYTYKDYLSDAWDDAATPTFVGVINYKAHRRLTLHFTAMRAFYETSTAGENAPSGAYLTRTNFSATAKYRINNTWSCSLQGFVGFDEYADRTDPTAPNQDAILFGGVFGLFWQPRNWVSFSLVYEYQNNDSKSSEDDFQENSVTLAARFTF